MTSVKLRDHHDSGLLRCFRTLVSPLRWRPAYRASPFPRARAVTAVTTVFAAVAASTGGSNPRDAKGPRHFKSVRGPDACDLELGRGTACGADLLASAAAELVRGDVDLDGQLAVAEHLDKRVLAHRARGHQFVDTDLAALGEQLVDVADVDDLVGGAEP